MSDLLPEVEVDLDSTDYAKQSLRSGIIAVIVLRLLLFADMNVKVVINSILMVGLFIVLWFLWRRKNWARLLILAIGMCELAYLPIMIRQMWKPIRERGFFGEVSLRILFLSGFLVSLGWLVYLLLQPDVRALYKGEPPRSWTRPFLAACALIFFVIGVVVAINLKV